MPEISTISAAVALLFTASNWLIINPLKDQMRANDRRQEIYMQQQRENTERLVKAMEKLTNTIEVTRAEVNDIRERLAKMEASVSSAHKRIDSLEGKYNG